MAGTGEPDSAQADAGGIGEGEARAIRRLAELAPLLTIEHGIRKPEKSQWCGKIKPIALEMKVGDSVLCPVEQTAYSLRSALKRLGRKSAVRKSREGWRVWRET